MHFKNVCAFLIIFSLIANFSLDAQNSLLQEEFANPDFSTPDNISEHVFNFFHHSCGANLLNDGLISGLEGLGYALHSRIRTTYQYENNYTDYRHWYKRFQRELGIPVDDHFYRYEGPAQNGGPTIGEQIDDDYRDFMLNYYEFNAELMDIIMFKPCYPGSNVSHNDTHYDGGTENNGFGNVIGGTPYSDNGTNNFTYLNSSGAVSDSYTNTHWSAGNWSGAGASLAQLKCAYRGMLNIFVEHPNILFIAMQAPPMVWLSADAANNCREFARWLREDWLHQYNPTGTDQFEDYPLKNVVPFDFHNSIAWTSDDSQLDNEYFWFVDNGMPDNSMDTANSDLIGRSASSEDHPDTWLNQREATIFCGGNDTYSPPHTGNTGRSYSPWIHAIVNRWEKSLQPVPVELTDFGYRLNGKDVTLYWFTASENNNLGFEIQKLSQAQRQFFRIGFVRGNGTTVGNHEYAFIDRNGAVSSSRYRLKQLNFDGTFEFSPEIEVIISIPTQYKLIQNYPNPFNTHTTIEYQIAHKSNVQITVYDLIGNMTKILVNEQKNPAWYQIKWDGRNSFGHQVNSGTYFIRMLLNSEIAATKKIVLLK